MKSHQKQRPWRPCRCCGGREVNKIVVGAAVVGKEWVIVECKFCESRRGAYSRNKQASKQEQS